MNWRPKTDQRGIVQKALSEHNLEKRKCALIDIDGGGM